MYSERCCYSPISMQCPYSISTFLVLLYLKDLCNGKACTFMHNCHNKVYLFFLYQLRFHLLRKDQITNLEVPVKDWHHIFLISSICFISTGNFSNLMWAACTTLVNTAASGTKLLNSKIFCFRNSLEVLVGSRELKPVRFSTL